MVDMVFAGIGVVAGGIGIALIVISECRTRREAEREVRRALFPIWEQLRRLEGEGHD